MLTNMCDYDKYYRKGGTYELPIEVFNDLIDEIDNLRKENKILKENAEHNDKVVDKARWNEMIYKSRIDKAINYIKSTNCYGMMCGKTLLQKHLYDLLNILDGSDDK